MLFVGIIRVIPNMNGIAGLDTYLHLTICDLVYKGLLIQRDLLGIFGLRAYGYPMGFHSLLSSLSYLSNTHLNTLFIIIPSVLSSIIAATFFLFSKSFNLTDKEAFLSTLLFTTAPSFVQRSSYSIPEIVGILFFLLSLSFLLRWNEKKDRKMIFLFLLVFFAYALTHRGIFFLLIVMFIFFLVYFREEVKRYSILIFFAILILILSGIGIDLVQRIPWEPVTAKGFILSLGPILFFLGIIGIFNAFERREKRDIFLLSWIVAFGLIGTMSFRFRDPYLAIPFSLIINPVRKDYLRILIPIVIIVGAIQSFYVIENGLYRLDKPTKYSLSFLQENSDQNSVVLTWRIEGYWINGLAKRRDIIIWNKFYQGFFNKPPSYKESLEKYKDVEEIFRTINSSRSFELMEKYNVSYIYFSRDMLNMDTLEYGLIEYIDKNERFSQIYANPMARVYKVDLNEA